MTAHLILNLLKINSFNLNNLTLFNTNLIIYLLIVCIRSNSGTTVRNLASCFALSIRSKHCKSKIIPKSKSYLIWWNFGCNWFNVSLNKQIYCLLWWLHLEFLKKSLYSILLLFCLFGFQKLTLFNFKLF